MVTIAFDWDIVTKCRNNLIAYIGELDFDISGEWGSDEMSELVTQFITVRQAQIESLSWIKYRYKFGKKRTLLL